MEIHCFGITEKLIITGALVIGHAVDSPAFFWRAVASEALLAAASLVA